MLMTIARRGGVCACLLLCGVFASAQTATPGRVLGLPEALARTVARNPELRVLGYQREALAGALTQASLLPNPELTVNLQDVLGGGIYNGVDNAETTVTLAWLLERGVRERRVDAARAGVELSGADGEILRLEIGAETARRFIECMAFQARLDWSPRIQLYRDEYRNLDMPGIDFEIERNDECIQVWCWVIKKSMYTQLPIYRTRI